MGDGSVDLASFPGPNARTVLLSGAGFALLRLYTGSLLPPAALHWAANGTGVVVGWFVARRQRATRELLAQYDEDEG